ncbi:MAG: hypothetical protein ACLP59_02590 [Bryobacteraceae bacterium]
MSEANAAGCAVGIAAPGIGMKETGTRLMARLKAIPWKRVLVDAMLVLAIILASSSVLTVR